MSGTSDGAWAAMTPAANRTRAPRVLVNWLGGMIPPISAFELECYTRFRLSRWLLPESHLARRAFVGQEGESWENPHTMRKPILAVLIRVLFLGILFVALPLRVENAAEAETLRYVILSAGKIAGSAADTYSPDGRIESTFELNDRGRGPKLAAHYVMGTDGVPSPAEITGNDYLKSPVYEHFAVENGRAHWKSTSEEGSASAGGFYVSNNGSGAEAAMLVAALAKAKGVPVRLYPSGEARLERLTDSTVENHGQSLHVTEYAITGLSFEPQALWLDDNLRLFGTPGKWFAELREGW